MNVRFKLSAVFTLVGVMSTNALAQECVPTDRWRISHSNGAVANMSVIDNDGGLVGTGREGRQTGELEGEYFGNSVSFTISWSNNHVGEYEGTISPNGRVTGFNNDAGSPTQQNTFVIRQAFEC